MKVPQESRGDELQSGRAMPMDDEILKEFLAESWENLSGSISKWSNWKSDPTTAKS